MKPGKVLTLLMLIAWVGLLASCAVPGEPRDPAYANGYEDGCVSGRAAQGSVTDREKKNANRFASDQQYAKGWTDGFKKCADQQLQQMAAGGR